MKPSSQKVRINASCIMYTVDASDLLTSASRDPSTNVVLLKLGHVQVIASIYLVINVL